MVREHDNDNGASWNGSSAEARGWAESAHRRVGALVPARLNAAMETRRHFSLFLLRFEALMQGDTSVRARSRCACLVGTARARLHPTNDWH